MSTIGVIDPLSVLSYVFNKVGVCISEDSVKKYWQHYRTPGIAAPWAMQHPSDNTHIPLGLYGDACKLRPGEKMVGIFLNLPLFRPKSIRCSRFLLCAVQEEKMHGRATLDCIFRYIVWRLNLAFHGHWPSCDINGGPLQPKDAARAGQWVVPNKCFAVTEVRGDWVWFKDIFSFKSSWKGGVQVPVCFKCDAWSVEPNLYYLVQPNSHVWDTEFKTAVDFIVHQCPARPSSLVACSLLLCSNFFRFRTMWPCPNPGRDGLDWIIFFFAFLRPFDRHHRLSPWRGTLMLHACHKSWFALWHQCFCFAPCRYSGENNSTDRSELNYHILCLELDRVPLFWKEPSVGPGWCYAKTRCGMEILWQCSCPTPTTTSKTFCGRTKYLVPRSGSLQDWLLACMHACMFFWTSWRACMTRKRCNLHIFCVRGCQEGWPAPSDWKGIQQQVYHGMAARCVVTTPRELQWPTDALCIPMFDPRLPSSPATMIGNNSFDKSIMLQAKEWHGAFFWHYGEEPKIFVAWTNWWTF